MTHEVKLQWQRNQRKLNGNIYTKRYEKTKSGFLMRAYRNMLSRVSGVQKLKAHLYYGKPIISKASFVEFSLASPEFHRLFDEWERSGYERRLAPSIDRIDSSHGYEIDNMQWVPFSENCRRGSISKHMKEGHRIWCQ